MPTIVDLLEDAPQQPGIKNATIGWTSQCLTIRGPINPVFRARLEDAINGDSDLGMVHDVNAADGLEVVEPVQAGIHGGYWYLRNVGHRDEEPAAGEARYRSLEEALEAAIAWWQAEPWSREVVLRIGNLSPSTFQSLNGSAAMAIKGLSFRKD